MNDWKQAFWLAKFEIKESILYYLAFFLFAVLFGNFLLSALPNNIEKSNIGFDIAFMVIFWAVATLPKKKEFQYSNIESDIWGNQFFNMLQQFPITRNVLIKSRFLLHYLISIPFHLLLLVTVYSLSSDIQAAIQLEHYLVFSFIWITFGIYTSSVFPASDTGDKLPSGLLFVYTIIFIGGIVGLMAAFYKLTGHGIVSWTLSLASEWPILSIVISTVLVFSNLFYWYRYAHKKIRTMDYFK